MICYSGYSKTYNTRMTLFFHPWYGWSRQDLAYQEYFFSKILNCFIISIRSWDVTWKLGFCLFNITRESLLVIPWEIKSTWEASNIVFYRRPVDALDSHNQGCDIEYFVFEYVEFCWRLWMRYVASRRHGVRRDVRSGSKIAYGL